MTSQNPNPGTTAPVQARHTKLPLLDENFSWEQFEDFSRDFVERMPDVKRVTGYGRKGDDQKGIDLAAEMTNGQTVSFQCRRVWKFTPKEFADTVADDTYGADRHVILLACQASSALRDAERMQATWEIWDVTDISRRVWRLSPQDRYDIVRRHFGDGVLVAFLGVTSAPAFRTWQAHFTPYMTPGSLFHHRASFVGRDNSLRQLGDAVGNVDVTVAILPGRGGVGKTRVLHQFGLEHRDQYPDRTLLYSDEYTPFTPNNLQQIPVGTTTLIVDDAHRREDLGQLLSFVVRDAAAGTTVVLAVRPEGCQRVSTVLSTSPIDTRAVLWLPELQELPRPDGEALAREVLGDELAAFAQRLYTATWDCPLVTVVGGELLREKRVDPALLERNDEFRQTVLARFSEAALARVDSEFGIDDGIDVLALVSALQPIAPENEEFRAAAATFLDSDVPATVRMLDALEAAGLLLRRGFRVRVVPDVLGDHLLHTRCLTSHGATTGYVDRLFDHFAGVAFDHILANVAELDWRVEAAQGSPTQLLDGVWHVFDTEFRSGSHATQVQLLGMLTGAAVFQASRVMDRVEYALDHPAEAPEPTDRHPLYTLGREHVRRVLADLANHCAHGGEVRRACNILWRLGRDDASNQNSNTSYPVRLLRELAAFSMYKPLTVNETVLRCTEAWLSRPDAHSHVHSPVDILEPFLAKSGRDTWADGASFQMQSYPVDPETTRAPRERAVELLTQLAGGDDPKVALRAVKVLADVLHEPLPESGRDISHDEKAVWHPDQMHVLEIFETLAGRTDVPLLQIAVNDAIAWTLGHSTFPHLREAATSVRAATPESFELRILRTLAEPWGRHYFLEHDMDEGQRLYDEALRQAADDLAAAKPVAEELVQFIEQRIDLCRSAGVSAESGRLIGLLGERHPGLGLAAAWHIADHPGYLLEPLLGEFVRHLHRRNPDEALRLAKVLSVADNGQGPAVVAWLYAYGGWAQTASSPDISLLSRLAESDDENVRALVGVALGRLKELDPAAGRTLAVSMRVGGSAAIGEAIAGLLSPPDSPIYRTLTDADLCKLLGQFEDLEDLDGYQLGRLLRDIAVRVPIPLLEMLIRRIDRLSEWSRGTGYDPTPSETSESIWTDVNDEQRTFLVRQLRDEYRGGGWPRVATFPYLYAEIGRASGDAIAILSEWICSGDDDRVRAAASLFGRAPQNYVFDNPDLVERWLDAAEMTSIDAVSAVRSAFWSSVHSEVKGGQPLQPFPRDLEIQRRSTELAARYDRGVQARRFYEALASEAATDIENQRKRDEELFEGPLPEQSLMEAGD